MNICIGNYLNIFTDENHVDEIDFEDDVLDIYIVFAEWFDEINEAEERAMNAIKKWKDRYYVRVNPDNPKQLRFIDSKIKKVLEREFEEEAILVYVKATQKLVKGDNI